MDFKIIAVDCDGTLCENKWPEMGEPNLELISYLKERQTAGDKLILWTCRAGKNLEKAVNWSAKHGLIFDAVNENLPEVLEWMGGDSRKIYADEYIDDRNVTLAAYKGEAAMKELSWNDNIKVKLTDYGRDVYYHQNDGLIAKGAKIERAHCRVDEDGFSEFLLWRFMEIFGPHIFMDAPAITEDTCFYINKSVMEKEDVAKRITEK